MQDVLLELQRINLNSFVRADDPDRPEFRPPRRPRYYHFYNILDFERLLGPKHENEFFQFGTGHNVRTHAGTQGIDE